MRYPPSKKQKEIIKDIESATGEKFTGNYSDEAYQYISKAFETYRNLMSINVGMSRLAGLGLNDIDDDNLNQYEGNNPMDFKN